MVIHLGNSVLGNRELLCIIMKPSFLCFKLLLLLRQLRIVHIQSCDLSLHIWRRDRPVIRSDRLTRGQLIERKYKIVHLP